MLKKIGIAVAVTLLAALGIAAYLNHEKPTPDTWSQALREYLGPSEYESVDPDKPLDQQTALFEIAGRTFEMPKVFISSNLGGRRVLEDGINLEYVLPDFTSKLDFPNRDAYKLAFKAGRFGRMLVKPETTRPSFDIVISNRRSGLTKEEYVGQFDGLEHYKWYHGKPEAPEYWSDVYLEKDQSGNVTSFVECTLSSRVPHCSHMFSDKALRYKVSYNAKNYFTEWREQRRKAVAFVDSFEVKPNPVAIKEDD